MLPTLGAVGSDKLDASTPCSEWSVQALINHNIRVALFFHSMMSSGELEPKSMFDVGGPLPSEGALAAFEASTSKVLEAIKVTGALEKVIDTPFGQMPVGSFLMFPFLDIVLHKWDFAKATGQNTSMDSSLAEASYNVLAPVIEDVRKGGAFEPGVQVPITASIQNKLLGLAGRQP